MIDTEQRKRVMERSMKLGHCICNPRQPCPCDLFKEKNVCLCAGERLQDQPEDVALTKLVENPGCASKINQNDLKQVLAGLPEISDPRVLVSTNTCDDAGVFKLSDESALVQSVDVFTPCSDDAYTFGQVAAANSLSDVYAMGGQPLTALAIIGFPIKELSPALMTQIMRGGVDKMEEAGVAVVGGHSIDDRDIKFGFAVTGMINPSKLVTNDRAQPGDVLVLTKPLGVGIINFASQLGRVSASAVAAADRTMAELNRAASETMVAVGVNAATDVTGFGLMGHLSELVAQSGVTAEIYADRVPIFDEVLDYVSQGMISGAVERNREYAAQFVSAAEDVSEELEYVFYDPQTSGGLLISVVEDKAESLVTHLHDSGVEHATIIGKVVSHSEGQILLKKSPGSQMPNIVVAPRQDAAAAASHLACCEPAVDLECCSSLPELGGEDAPAPVSTTAGTSTEMKQRFSDFMGAVNAEGAINTREKELMAIALSLLAKCEPCVKLHIDKSRKIGLTEEEIEEAVWMAISFGGAPIMMFYDSIRKQI